MARISEIARIRSDGPGENATDIERDAFVLWRSVVSEAQRRKLVAVNGKYTYEGTLSHHVRRLWPGLVDEELTAKSRELYTFLRDSENARCIRTQNPTVWLVSDTWLEAEVRVTPRFRLSNREKRVTPEEAGENLEPAPLIIVQRRKDDTPVTKTKTQPGPAPTKSHDERAQLIQAALEDSEQPLTAPEVSHVTGEEISVVRKTLKKMIEANPPEAFSRQETPEERLTRFGSESVKAMRATLYSLYSPVPERTKQEAVKGYKREAAAQGRPMSSAEIERRLSCKIAKMGNRWRFTAQSLAKDTGISLGTVQSRLKELTARGFIEVDGHRDHMRVFRVVEKKREQLLRVLNYAPPLPEPEQQQQPEPEATTTAPPEPRVIDREKTAKLVKMVRENKALKEEVELLRAQVAELQAQVAEYAEIQEALDLLG